jgi:hypothetical protein
VARRLATEKETSKPMTEDPIFSEPDEAIVAYAHAHGFHEDLRLRVIQNMLRLRMAHPEWEEEKTFGKPSQDWPPIGAIVYYVERGSISVGRVDRREQGLLVLALPDQEEEAKETLYSYLYVWQYPATGMYLWPKSIEFNLTFERAAYLPGYWRRIPLE